MTPEAQLIAIVGALVAAQTGMIWFLLRDTRTAVLLMGRQVSDLTLAIALDVATRPGANADTRRIARRIAHEHGGEVRSRDLREAEE